MMPREFPVHRHESTMQIIYTMYLWEEVKYPILLCGMYNVHENAAYRFKEESRASMFILYVSLSAITHSDLRGRGMGRL